MSQDEKNTSLFNKYKIGDTEARDKFVINNLPLVRYIAGRFVREETDIEDLFQEGCIGLLKAIESYDPKKGTRFSTYAVPFILGEIRSYLRRQGHFFKVSRSFHEHCRELFKKIYELEQTLKRKPHIEELVEIMQMTKEEIVWLLDYKSPLIPLYGKEFVSKNDFGTDDYLQGILLMEKIKTLPKRERQLMVLRYYMGKTQEETALLLGISQTHVSRLERKVLQKIKEEYDR